MYVDNILFFNYWIESYLQPRERSSSSTSSEFFNVVNINNSGITN
jgi:hypothetical protein